MKNTIFTVKVLLAMLISTISQWGFAQESTRIHVSSALNEDETISIDGQLIENEAPTYQTSFKIAYDAKYMYIGIIANDESVDLINKRMSRRDGYNGDWIEVIIDGYHDLRSAVSFS